MEAHEKNKKTVDSLHEVMMKLHFLGHTNVARLRLSFHLFPFRMH